MDSETDFFQKMLLTKNIQFKDHKLLLMGKSGILVNMDIFVGLQRPFLEGNRQQLSDVAYSTFSNIIGEYKKNMSEEQFIEFVKSVISASGFGEVDMLLGKGVSNITMSPSVFADRYAELYGLQESPVCIFIAAGIRALLDTFYGQEGQIEEVDCRAMGKNKCSFVYTSGNLPS